MARVPGSSEEERRARRALLRRANLYLAGLILFTVALGLGGTALIAWLITRRAGGFLTLWLVLAALVLVPPALVTVWRTRGAGGARGHED
ncbi:MAG: hypothetical protein WEA24_16475 [Gemmatimonadota bacterium]